MTNPFETAHEAEPDAERIAAIVHGLKNLAETFDNNVGLAAGLGSEYLIDAVRAGAFSGARWLEFCAYMRMPYRTCGVGDELLRLAIEWLHDHRERLPIERPPEFPVWEKWRICIFPPANIMRMDLLDLATLLEQTVAEVESEGVGQKRNRCPRGQAPEWILSYLCEHHAYDGESIGNWPHVTLDEVVEGLEGRVGKTTVSKWFRNEFGGHDAYRVACQQETLLPKLQKMRQDFNKLFDPEKVLLNQPDSRAEDPAHD